MMNLKLAFFKIFCLVLLALASLNTQAQTASDYPNKPIRFILPFPAGGGTDSLSRIMAPKLGQILGQPIVIDNRPGAAGNIATEAVTRAEPDGYTVLMGYNTALTMNPYLYKNLPFDIQRDLQPITLLATAQYFLVVNQSVQAQTLSQLVALAKAQPGKLNYSSGGPGSSLHLAAELFKNKAGINIVHIPYKGGGPAVMALLGEEVQMTFGSAAAVMPHIKSGSLRALAVTGLKRSPLTPNVPTLDELGYTGFNVTSWYGLLVPKKTPEKAVATLQSAAQKVIQMPEVREAMAKQGLEVATDSQAEFIDLIKTESQTWSDLVKKIQISVN